MTTYRLSSSPLVHTPGLISWAINGYEFEADQAQMIKVICSTFQEVPAGAVRKLLSKAVIFSVEG